MSNRPTPEWEEVPPRHLAVMYGESNEVKGVLLCRCAMLMAAPDGYNLELRPQPKLFADSAHVRFKLAREFPMVARVLQAE